MNLSKKLSQGMLTRRTSQQTLLEHFNRMATKEDFERIRDKWTAACEAEGLMLHNNVSLEFKKRIERCGQNGERAKLDFTNCGLDDRRLTLLIEALAKKPVIYKLDLDKNHITHEGLKILRKLLKGQLKLVKDFDIDKRLHASFLAEVSLLHNSIETSSSTLAKVQQALKILKYCNAQAYIRSVYINSSAPEQLSYPFVMKMWLNIVGKPDKDQIKPAFEAAGVEEKPIIFYKELEAVLLQGLIQRGLLQNVTAEELSTIETPGPLVRENSWDRLPTMNSVIANNRASGDYSNNLDGINVLDDNFATSPKQTVRKVPHQPSTKKSVRKTMESPRSDSEDLLGEDDEIVPVSVDDIDTVLKNTPLSMRSASEEMVLGFEPTIYERPSMKKSLSTVPEAEECEEDPCDERSSNFGPGTLSRPRSLSRSKDKIYLSSKDQASHSLDDLDALINSYSSSKRKNSFGSKNLSPGSREGVESQDSRGLPNDNNELNINRLSISNPSESTILESELDNMSAMLSIYPANQESDMQQQSSTDDKPLDTLPPDNAESNKLNLTLASDNVKCGEDLLGNEEAGDGKGLSIKTNGFLFDSPTVRVNTAEVYDAEDLFLESNPMHDDGDSLLSGMASGSFDFPGSARMIGKSPGRRPSRSGTPTNVLRAQRESQTRTPQSLLRSTSQGQIAVPKPRDMKEEVEKISPQKQPGSGSKSKQNHSSNKENFRSGGSNVPDNQNPVEITSPAEVSSVIVPMSEPSKAQQTSSQPVVRSLDLAHKQIQELHLVEYLEPDMLQGLRVLILRNIGLSNLSSLRLQRWVPGLTDLDLGNNKLAGKLEEDSIPTKLLRLDLSFNQLTDVTAVMKCFELVHLDLSHNLLKNLYGLPIKLERLNLSNNKLISVGSLRSLTMCSSLQSISILNNPMTSQIPNIRVFLMSLFRNLVEYDGIRFANPKPVVKPTPKPKKIENPPPPPVAAHSDRATRNSNSKTNTVNAPASVPHRSSSVGKSKSGGSTSNSASTSTTKSSVSKKEQALNDQRRLDVYLEKQKAMEKAKVERERQAIEALEGPKKKVVLKSDQVDRLTSRLTAPRQPKETPQVQIPQRKQSPRPPARKSSTSTAPSSQERSSSRPKERSNPSVSTPVYSNYVAKPKPSLLVSVLNTSSSSFRLQNVLKLTDETELSHHNLRHMVPVQPTAEYMPLPHSGMPASSSHAFPPPPPGTTSPALVLKGGRSTTPNSTQNQQSGTSKFKDEGLKLNDINTKLPVVEYIDGLSLELGRMAAAFKLVYMLFDKDTLIEDDLIVFNSSFERFLDSDFKQVPNRVVNLLNGVDSLSYVEEKHKINLYHEQYDKVIQLFTQIQTMLQLSIQSGVHFYDSVQLLMNSKLGKYVNENVLAKFFCSFDGKSTPSKVGIGTSSVHVNTQNVNVSTPVNLFKDANSRSPFVTSRTPTTESSDFVHKIREPMKEASSQPEVIVPQKKDHQKLPTTETRSAPKDSGIAENSEDTAIIEQENPLRNPLDRVRSRVVQKYLPQKATTGLTSPEKGPITLRGGHKSTIRGGDHDGSEVHQQIKDEVVLLEDHISSKQSDAREEGFQQSNDGSTIPTVPRGNRTLSSASIESVDQERSPMSMQERVKLFSKNSPLNRSTSAFTKPEVGKAAVVTTSTWLDKGSPTNYNIKSIDSADQGSGSNAKLSHSNNEDVNIIEEHAPNSPSKRKTNLDDDAAGSHIDQAADNKLKKMLSSAPAELVPNSDFKKRNVAQDELSSSNKLSQDNDVDEEEILKTTAPSLMLSLTSSYDFNYPEGDPTIRILSQSPEHMSTNTSGQALPATPLSKESTSCPPPITPIVVGDKLELEVPALKSESIENSTKTLVSANNATIPEEADESSVGSTSSKMNAKERLKARLRKNRLISESQDSTI